MNYYKNTMLALVSFSILISCQKEDIPLGENPAEEPKSSTPSISLSNYIGGSILKSESTEDLTVLIEGKACDSINPISSMTINNIDVALDANGDCMSFSEEVQGNWGLNIIDILAKNKLGDEVSMVQSYLHSPNYFPNPEAVEENTRLPAAWRGRMGQEVLDDSDRSDMDDFATLIETAINNYNFDELIPVRLIDYSTSTYECGLLNKETFTLRQGVRVEKAGVFNIGEVDVNSLGAHHDSFSVDFLIGHSRFPILVDGYYDKQIAPVCTPIPLHATTQGTIGFERAEVSGTFTVAYRNNQVFVSSNFVTVDLIDPFVEIELTGIDLIDNLLSEAINLLNNWWGGYIADVLEDYVKEEIPTIMEGIINDFSINPVIDIPAPVNVQLNVNAVLDDVKVGQDYIDLSLAARVTPSEYKKDEGQLSYGSIVGESALPLFNGMNGTFGLGLKDDFVNQVFWAVWAAGGFDEEAGSTGEIADALVSAGLNATILSIETGLPPVLMPGDVDDEVKIGIGEIQVSAEVSPLLLGQLNFGSDKAKISSNISVILTGTFQVQAETRELIFIPSSNPETHVQINDYVWTNESIDLEEKLGDFASELLLRYITEVIGGIELPSIPIGEHVDSVPAGTTWILDNGTMDYAEGYHRIVGEVGVVTD